MRLLLLEDDAETASALQRGLALEGHEVEVARDVTTALALLEGHAFEVAILDVTGTGGSAYDVLGQIRAEALPSRVLMLTEDGDRGAAGRDSAPDDSLPKPFSFAALSARVSALGRREEASELRHGPLRLDVARRRAWVNDDPLELTPTEFGLLRGLLRSPGRIVSRGQLLREVWAYDFEPAVDLVEVHVNRLRRRLDARGVPGVIRTVRSQGYVVG